eukprot:6092954-Pyramimonas_sp.AAC.1
MARASLHHVACTPQLASHSLHPPPHPPAPHISPHPRFARGLEGWPRAGAPSGDGPQGMRRRTWMMISSSSI